MLQPVKRPAITIATTVTTGLGLRTPLSTQHPVFGRYEKHISFYKRRDHPKLSTFHPVFDSTKKGPYSAYTTDVFLSERPLTGPTTVSGLFFAIDPNLCFGRQESMNPTARLTIKDNSSRRFCRLRYRCILKGERTSNKGFKVEALVRFALGWVSPALSFKGGVPRVIHLGRGIDVSIPLLFHYTMVTILDEKGFETGSYLYLSGTPWLGLSCGFTFLSGGRLVLDEKDDINMEREDAFFLRCGNHQVHFRQLGFVLLKFLAWSLCALLVLPLEVREYCEHLAVRYIPAVHSIRW